MPYHRFIQANLDRLLDSPEKALLRVTKAKRRAQTFAKRSGRWVKRRWLLNLPHSSKRLPQGLKPWFPLLEDLIRQIS